MAAIKLTVFFEDPFWVGVVEREEQGVLQVTRHLFGAEPSGPEVLEFVQRRLASLLERPRAAVAVAPTAARPANPKRAARVAARALAERGTSTQAQEACAYSSSSTSKNASSAAGPYARPKQPVSGRSRLPKPKRAIAATDGFESYELRVVSDGYSNH